MLRVARFVCAARGRCSRARCGVGSRCISRQFSGQWLARPKSRDIGPVRWRDKRSPLSKGPLAFHGSDVVTGLRQRANYPRFNRSVRIAIRKTRGTLKGDRCRVVFVWSSGANRSALMPFWKKSEGSISIFGRFVASVLKARRDVETDYAKRGNRRSARSCCPRVRHRSRGDAKSSLRP